MKIVNFLLAAQFFFFAYLQMDDPDPGSWMTLYVFTGFICILAAFGHANKYLLWAGISACIIWMGFLLPEFIGWINNGMPNIAKGMKAEEPYVEFTREFLGIGICLAVMIWQLVRLRKSNALK